MSEDEQVHTGACLCGAVSYRVSGPLQPVIACHCEQCRRQSGNFVAATAAPREAVTVTGADGITWYASSDRAERGFCAACGSQLFWRPTRGGMISIFAGTLDQPTGLRLAGHIYCADKGDYYAIADGLPQFPGEDQPPGAWQGE